VLVFPNLFFRGGTPKIIFYIPRTLTYKTFTGQLKLIWRKLSVATVEAALYIFEATTDTEQLSIALNTNCQQEVKEAIDSAWRLFQCDLLPTRFRRIFGIFRRNFKIFVYLFQDFLREQLTTFCVTTLSILYLAKRHYMNE
jgi:hypothetical protein